MVAKVYHEIVEEALSLDAGNVVSDCAIGQNTMAVELSCGIGTAMVYDKAVCAHKDLREIESQVCGMSVAALAQKYLEPDSFWASVGLAAINALLNTQVHSEVPDYEKAFAGCTEKSAIAMVGFFGPIVNYARKHGFTLKIFELRDIAGTYRPADAGVVMPSCETVILTGSAFSNRTIDAYFPYISPNANAFILGPSTPMAKCLSRFHLGTSLMTDKEAVFAAIRANASCGALRRWMKKVGRTAHMTGSAS